MQFKKFNKFDDGLKDNTEIEEIAYIEIAGINILAEKKGSGWEVGRQGCQPKKINLGNLTIGQAVNIACMR